ncbi:MAG: alpha-2-macroglobulin family protein [Pseudomonadota bacterium]
MKLEMNRTIAGFAASVLLFLAPHCGAGADDNPIQYGPVGAVREARLIHLTFGVDIDGFSKDADPVTGEHAPPPDPATVTCSGTSIKPLTRWQNRHYWTAEFGEGALAAGAVCTVQPRAQKSAGVALRMPKPWRFSVVGPRVTATLPPITSDAVSPAKEDPVTAFLLSDLPDRASLQHLRCSVNKVDVPVRILDGEAAAEAWRRLALEHGEAAEPPKQAWLLARCGNVPWPNGAQVVWTWGKNIVTPGGAPSSADIGYALKVRAPFGVALTCRQLFAIEGCDPAGWINLEFSHLIAAGNELFLRGSSGARYTLPKQEQYDGVWSERRFYGPFVPGEAITLELPHAMVDVDGRALTGSPALSTPVRIARLPPYVGMDKVNGVLEWHPGKAAMWPVVARTAGPLAVRSWQFGRGAQSTPALLALHTQVRNFGLQGPKFALPFETSAMLLASLPGGAPPALEQTIDTPPAQTVFAGIPLAGYGSWLVEADSPAFREAVRIQRAEIFRQGKLRPASELDVDFDGTLLWDFVVLPDLDALARKFAASGPTTGADDNVIGFYPNKLVKKDVLAAIVATARRHGVTLVEGPERDMTLLNPLATLAGNRMALVQLTNMNVSARLSRRADSLVWITAFDSGKPVADASVEFWSRDHRQLMQAQSDAHGRVVVPQFTAPAGEGALEKPADVAEWIVARHGEDVAVLNANWDGAEAPDTDNADLPSELLSHTILDRVLLRAGDSISMHHVVRAPSATGWEIPAVDKEAKTQLRIYHASAAAPLSEQLLTWTVDGNAYSSWKIPADAKLGLYRYELHGDSGELGRGTFQVEQFRLPAFDATLALESVWQDRRQALHIGAGLSFMAGGSAAGQVLTLKGRYTPGAPAPRTGYEFIDHEAAPGAIPAFADIAVTLDRHGRASSILEAPPSAAPLTLQTQMQFADANGEVQVRDTQLAVWPQRLKIGMRVGRAAAPSGALISVLVLDEADRPVAGHSVTVDAARRGPGVRGEAVREPVCVAMTDAQGGARCEMASIGPGQGGRWVLRARAAYASTAALLRELPLPQASTGAVLEAVGDGSDSVRVRPPFVPATMLLTVEREGVLSSQVHTLTAPEQEFALPAVSSYAPEVDVTARFVRGSAQPAANAAERERLSSSTTLTMPLSATGAHRARLYVKLQPSTPTARPGQKVGIAVQVTRALNGVAASGAKLTLIVVDDALLALKPNPSWSVDQTFWAAWRRAEGMRNASLEQLWSHRWLSGVQDDYVPPSEAMMLAAGPAHASVLERVFDWNVRVEQPPITVATSGPEPAPARPDEPVRVLHSPVLPIALAAGAHAAAPPLPVPQAAPWLVRDAPPRTNFAPRALWRTSVKVDRHGKARLSFVLPDSLTRWRIMAIAIEGSDAYGNGEAHVTGALPVQLVSGLPQSLRSADVVVQQLTVRNASAAPLVLQLRARAQVVAAAGSAPQSRSDKQMLAQGLQLARTLALAAGESHTASWPVTVPHGAARLDWSIETRAGGRVADAIKVAQAVVPALPLTARQYTVVQVDKARTVRLDGVPGAESGSVRVRWRDSLVSSAIEGARAWIGDYPHACMEQRSSRAALSGSIEQWNLVMASLPLLTDERGLVRYYRATPGSEVLTAYLLELADAYGLPLPAAEKARMQQAMREVLANRPGRRHNDWMPDANLLPLRLSIQALGEARGTAPVTPPSLAQLPTQSLLDWARYLLATPASPERHERLALAAAELRGRYVLHGATFSWRQRGDAKQWWLMWSEDVVSAKAVLLLLQWRTLDPLWDQVLPAMVTKLIGLRARDHWDTTVSNIWSVAALRGFAKTVEQGRVSGTSGAVLGAQGGSVKWPLAGANDFALVDPAQPQSLALRHAGRGAPWASVTVLASSGKAPARSSGLSVRRSVSAVEQRVKGVWSVGDVLKVTLDMSSTAPLTWIAVVDPIPSGATILGKGLAREGGVGRGESLPRAPSVVERGDDSFRAYYEHVEGGGWRTEYLVRLNNSGNFGLPPTRIEAMYAPAFFGEAPNQGLQVQP